MKTLKNLNISKIKKNIIWILLFIIVLYLWVFLYSYIFEKDKIAIDRYNFEQLEKVKKSLDNEKTDYRFRNLRDFNNKYNLNIQPIKNCYYIVTTIYFDNYKWDSKYIFWFHLESLIYKFINFWWNYTYPKYDLPVYNICIWGNRCDYDSNKAIYEFTISNPCQD
jgi:hypothetical protein